MHFDLVPNWSLPEVPIVELPEGWLQKAMDKSMADKGQVSVSIRSATLNGCNPRRQGSVVHAIADWNGIDYHVWPAVCGKKPGKRSAGWCETSQEVTCPKCKKMIGE